MLTTPNPGESDVDETHPRESVVGDIHPWDSDVYASSKPAAPRTPPGYCGAFAHPVSPGSGEFANFVLPGGWAFANPGAIPKLLTRTRLPIRI